MTDTKELITIKQASALATEHIGKTVTPSNIAYLINYGRIPKVGDNGGTLIVKQDLIDYYETSQRETNWKKQLGADLNWALSFDQYTESQTIKHVHRLHPYKGKFIPQLVEYFLDAHEIGALAKKQSKQAQADYAKGIANVLNNCRCFLAEGFDVFLVANDKYNLYPQIAEDAKMQIVNQYKRPILNRTEKDKGAYSEIIFHLKKR